VIEAEPLSTSIPSVEATFKLLPVIAVVENWLLFMVIIGDVWVPLK